MKILIVDDSKAMRGIVLRTLRRAGYDGHAFLEASNGVEALAVVDRESPDLILADWNMPEMSGLELLQTLRGRSSPVKLGFVTSEGTEEMKKTAFDAGAAFLITKPFTVETFQESLKPVIV